MHTPTATGWLSDTKRHDTHTRGRNVRIAMSHEMLRETERLVCIWTIGSAMTTHTCRQEPKPRKNVSEKETSSEKRKFQLDCLPSLVSLAISPSLLRLRLPLLLLFFDASPASLASMSYYAFRRDTIGDERVYVAYATQQTSTHRVYLHRGTETKWLLYGFATRYLFKCQQADTRTRMAYGKKKQNTDIKTARIQHKVYTEFTWNDGRPNWEW